MRAISDWELLVNTKSTTVLTRKENMNCKKMIGLVGCSIGLAIAGQPSLATAMDRDEKRELAEAAGKLLGEIIGTRIERAVDQAIKPENYLYLTQASSDGSESWVLSNTILGNRHPTKAIAVEVEATIPGYRPVSGVETVAPESRVILGPHRLALNGKIVKCQYRFKKVRFLDD